MIHAHTKALTDQLARIIADGNDQNELAVCNPEATARALFDAASRFHNPANAGAWADPGTNEAYQAVRSLVLAELAKATAAPTTWASTGVPHAHARFRIGEAGARHAVPLAGPIAQNRGPVLAAIVGARRGVHGSEDLVGRLDVRCDCG